MSNTPKLNISLDKTTAIICEECGNNIFQEGTMLRKASKILIGSHQDALVPIPVFVCSKCGHVNEEFIPGELKQN
jgi:uncharacterized Zn finger protein